MTAMNWHETTFGELIDIKHGFAFKGDFFGEAGDYIVLTPGNFHEFGGMKLKGEKEKFYTDAPPEEYVLNRGDLVVAMTDLVQNAPILGSTAFVPESGKFLHNQRLGKITVKRSDLVSSEFIFWLFNSYSVRGQIKGSASGSTVRHTSPSRIYEVSVKLPPLSTQRKIASILSAYDDLIENNTRRIAILEEMAQAIYREWFVHFRFPGHENVKLVDSPLGQIPEGWKVTTLGTLCVEKKGIQTGPFGSQLHRSDYADEGTPVVMPKDILQGRISDDSIAKVPDSIVERLPRHILEYGDTVCARRGEIGRNAFVTDRESGWMCGTGCMRIRPRKDVITSRFLFDTLSWPDTVSVIAGKAAGAIMPNLNIGIMESIPIILPTTDVMSEYERLAMENLSLLNAMSAKNRNLGTTRDLLLPKLISGKLDVEDLDIDTGELAEELEEATA